MNQILVDCPTHGVVPHAGVIGIGAGMTATFVGGSANCPICALPSDIISGDYGTDSQGISTAVISPTPAQRKRLLTALEWAQRSLVDASLSNADVEQKIRRTVEKEAPQIVSMVDKAFGTKSAGLAAWVAVMLTILQMLTNSNAPQITPEFIEKVIEQVQNVGGDDGGTKPSQPAPTEKRRPQEPEGPLIVKT